jgi:threonine dehydratase
MAGLACGESSPLALRFLRPRADWCMTIEDAEAVATMQLLAVGSEHDLPVVAGESGRSVRDRQARRLRKRQRQPRKAGASA